jgi:hypothetical protein
MDDKNRVLWVIAIALVVIALAEVSQSLNLYDIEDLLAKIAG